MSQTTMLLEVSVHLSQLPLLICELGNETRDKLAAAVSFRSLSVWLRARTLAAPGTGPHYLIPLF